MSSLKQYLVPSLAILLASAILILAFTPLENTAWADGIRARPTAEASNDPFVANDDASLIARIIRPIDALLKVALFMGIPGWITWRIVRKAAPKPEKVNREKG